jgi:UDP-N-acetylmuramoyl-tripeptide--D-alanyl-D-alanine ligase
MEPHERADGLLLINDAYNANPDSMTAALETLAGIGRRSGRRTVAVLGEMRELGEAERAGHLEVGTTVATLGIDVVVTVGAVAAAIAEGAARVAGWPGVALVTAGRDEALAWVRNNVSAGDVVLVKASRGAALEVLADGLLTGPNDSGPTDSDPTDEGVPTP